MKKISALTCVALFQVFALTTAVANDAFSLESASESELTSIVNLCREDAKDEEIEASMLTEYLSLCINDELNANDYAQLTAIQLSALLKK